jgi:acetyl esterase/lipase
MPVEFSTDILFGRVDGRDLLLDIARPAPAPDGLIPAIIHIHGGGWEAGVRDASREIILAENGFFYASVDYRLSWEAPFPAQIQDVKAAVRWLRAHAEDYQVDPNRIGVWGHSAGGHLASLLGTSGSDPELEGGSGAPDHSSEVQAVFAVSTPTDFFAEDFGGRDDPHADTAAHRLLRPIEGLEERARRASPIYGVVTGLPPFFLVHGAVDETVPVTQSRRFYAALVAAGVDATYVEFARAAHDLGPYWDETRHMMLQFFRRHLT